MQHSDLRRRFRSFTSPYHLPRRDFTLADPSRSRNADIYIYISGARRAGGKYRDIRGPVSFLRDDPPTHDEKMLRMSNRMLAIDDRRASPRVCLTLVIFALSIIDTMNAAATTAGTVDNAWTEFSTSCASEDTKNVSVSCHGVRIVRKIVQQLLDTTSKERNIELFEGVSLVGVPGSSRKARVLKGFRSLGPFLQFLEGRELRVKLPSLLPPNIETALKESLPSETEGW